MASESERLVRKLRKKLRQIENLEILDRDLNQEEAAKVEKKEDIRLELRNLLPAVPPVAETNEEVDGFTVLNVSELESDEMKRKSSEAFEALNESKKSCPSSPSSVPVEDSSVSGSGAGPDPSESAGPEVQTASTSGQNDKTSESSRTRGRESEAELQRKQQKEAKKEQQKRLQSVISTWRRSCWRVTDLEGHEDLVLDCDLGRTVAVTGSRDTTVKVWSLETGELQHSLRGHTGAVTGVRVLQTEEDRDRLETSSEVAVSAGQDCNIKVWNLSTGECIK